jgi:hypothetical protein
LLQGIKMENNHKYLYFKTNNCRYTCVKNHLVKVFATRKSWALCFRDELPLRGNNTNNFVEAAFGVLKDKVFLRNKAYNVTQLLAFLTTCLEHYYERRLIDAANNQLDLSRSKYLGRSENIDMNSIIHVSEMYYQVPSENTSDLLYDVDMALGLCTCFVGKTGGPCKHQHAVLRKYPQLQSLNFAPTNSPSMCTFFYSLALGSEANIPTDWFAPLHADVQISAEDAQIARPLPPSHDTSVLPDPQPIETPAPEEMLIRVEKAESDLSANMYQLTERLRRAPESLINAVEAFNKHFSALQHSESALASALHTFGRSGAMPRRIGGRTIPVQPTAIARRKVLMGGRKKATLGRRPKANNAIKRTALDIRAAVLPPRKAPHSIASCVATNKSLGKTHAGK